MDFAAIDFETANSRPDSACQLAVVIVREGRIEVERSWLIRPPRLFFSRRNVAIHGIGPEQVRSAGTMEQVWAELTQLVDGQVLLAHNARFDIGVLVASLAAYEIACPHLEFSCTRAIARQAWPGRARYGLKPLGVWLGINFRHHDALEDSRCCARIALAAAATVKAVDIRDLERRLRLTRGRYGLGRISAPRALGGRSDAAGAPVRSRQSGRGQLDAAFVMESAAGSQPLADKHIVCVGCLRGLTTAETQQLIVSLGGVWQTQIGSDTDYVIACGGVLLEEASRVIAHQSAQKTPLGYPTLFPDDAQQESPGKPIRLLSERQFLALLPGGRAAVRW